MLRALAAAASLAASSSAYAPGVAVTTSGGTTIDSSSVFANYAYAGPTWSRSGGSSFQLSDKGDFSNAEWGIADYATQGSLIAEKLLSLGGDSQRSVVRGWALKLPADPNGRAWGTEESPYHMGGQGAFEGTAEAILIARHFIAHTGETNVISSIPERIVCYSPEGSSTPILAGVSQPGLDDSTCSLQPAQILTNAYPALNLYSEWPTPPATVVTQFFTLLANGKGLTEAITFSKPFTSFSLPLTPQSGGGATPWPLIVTLYDANTGNSVASAPITSGNGNTWSTVSVGSGGNSLPAGDYIITIVCQDRSAEEEEEKEQWQPTGPARRDTAGLNAASSSVSSAVSFTQFGWVSNPSASFRGGAGQVVYANTSTNAVVSAVHTWTLAERLAAGMLWQLNNSMLPGGDDVMDVLTIRDPRYKGTGDVGVNSGSSYYDLYRIGFASAYVNLRFLESLVAFAEMQEAGFLPSTCPPPSRTTPPCIPSTTINSAITALRALIGLRFGVPGTGSFIEWVSCNCTDASSNTLTCDVTKIVNGSVGGGGAGASAGAPAPARARAHSGPGFTNFQQSCGDSSGGMAVVDIDFVPTQALALKLGVTPVGDSLSLVASTLTSYVSSLRITPGKFRTNGKGFEDSTVGPRLWLAFDRWKYVDSDGFAIREAQQTGDWMIFSPSAGGDGNGNFGLQEENGGALLSTNSFVYEAFAGAPSSSVVPSNLLSDWQAEVESFITIGAALSSHNTTGPILPGGNASNPFLRIRMTSQLVIQLCENPRGGPGSTDWWGDRECSFYKSVTTDLPENGLALFSFAKGFLGLRVDAGGDLWVGPLGSQSKVPIPGTITLPSAPPAWAAAVASGKGVSSLTVSGLAVGGLRGVTVAATLNASTGAVSVVATVGSV